MQIHVVEIQRITPRWMFPGLEGDDTWVKRETVRTFKVAGDSQADCAKLADQLLEAFLQVEGGIGTWSMHQWFVR